MFCIQPLELYVIVELVVDGGLHLVGSNTPNWVKISALDKEHSVPLGSTLTFGPLVGYFTTHSSPRGKTFLPSSLKLFRTQGRDRFQKLPPADKRGHILPGVCRVCGDNSKMYLMSVISSTPAAFALVARRTVTEEPLLLLQSREIDLVVDGHPEEIQVLFVGRQHLFSQACESLGRENEASLFIYHHDSGTRQLRVL